MNNHSLLELTQACYNKVESEFVIDKYLTSSPWKGEKNPYLIWLSEIKTMLNLLESNGFISLHNFTQFLIHKYNSDLNPNEIFILQSGTYVVIVKQRQTLLNFFTSVIRDLQLNQLID